MPWKPRTFLALLVAGMGCWLERQGAAQIEYLKAENRLLRARLGRRRFLFTDPERRTLAVLAKEIGSKMLRDLVVMYTRLNARSPSTLLIASYWEFPHRSGQPQSARSVSSSELSDSTSRRRPP